MSPPLCGLLDGGEPGSVGEGRAMGRLWPGSPSAPTLHVLVVRSDAICPDYRTVLEIGERAGLHGGHVPASNGARRPIGVRVCARAAPRPPTDSDHDLYAVGREHLTGRGSTTLPETHEVGS